jgi:hypothetical protein
MYTRVLHLLFGTALAGAAPIALAGGACRVEAPSVAPRVIELYTSEGCNSCPPADRWLSALRGRSDVLPVAFHVDYWDRLGWRDRFADARFTERQSRSQAHSGVRFSYTPQVIVDGTDWRQWPHLPTAERGPSPVRLALWRDGERVHWRVEPVAGAAQTLALWWAVLEDGHRSDVRAGENRGVVLRHDHVVRRYGTEPPWTGVRTQAIDAPAVGEDGRRTRTVVVVTDNRTGRPVQAAEIACDA